MNFLALFYDSVQVLFACYVWFDTYRKIYRMTRQYNDLPPWQKQIVTIREELGYSPKTLLISKSFLVGFFAILQVAWSLDAVSERLSPGYDFAWFLFGFLLCCFWLKGNTVQWLVWAGNLFFRESEPPCGVEVCPVEDINYDS